MEFGKLSEQGQVKSLDNYQNPDSWDILDKYLNLNNHREHGHLGESR
jgi:hypothetical protein